MSRDPAFVAKVTDVVGLYLNPPENAIVLSVDEKTSIQALERTQLPLPLRQGRQRDTRTITSGTGSWICTRRSISRLARSPTP